MVAEVPAVERNASYFSADYAADVARLRALGCRCMLHCVLDQRGEDDTRVHAAPLNDLVGDACSVDHQWSYTT